MGELIQWSDLISVSHNQLSMFNFPWIEVCSFQLQFSVVLDP